MTGMKEINNDIAIILNEDSRSDSFGHFITENMKLSGVHVIDSKLLYKMKSSRKIRTLISSYKMIIIFEENRLVPVLFLCKAKQCRLVLWNWNIVAKKRARKINLLKPICSIWTFDERDAKNYRWKLNTQFYFRPAKKEQPQDAVFCSIDDKGRYNQLQSIKKRLEADNITCDFTVLRRNGSSELNLEMVTDKEIPYMQYLTRMDKCNTVVDLLQPGQEGMTMRTMEALFYQKKLITNNIKIIDELIYKTGRANIFVIGFDCAEQLTEFVSKKQTPWPENIREHYEFSSWLRRFE